MLPKRHRLDLRHAAPFYKFSHKRHLPLYSLYWSFVTPLPALALATSTAATTPESFSQAAVIVSKKVAPTAVERNQIKRVVRATLTPLFPALPDNLQLVIVIKNVSIRENLPSLHAELSKIALSRSTIST